MEAVQERDHLKQLLAALESGWEIDEPVLVGNLWQTNHNVAGGVYHFVLRNKSEDKTSLLSVQPSPELLTFLSEHKFQVNSR